MNQSRTTYAAIDQLATDGPIYITVDDLALRTAEDGITLVENGQQGNVNAVPGRLHATFAPEAPQTNVKSVPVPVPEPTSNQSRLGNEVSAFVEHTASPQELRQIAAIMNKSHQATQDPSDSNRAGCDGIDSQHSLNRGRNASDTDSDSRRCDENRALLSSHQLTQEELGTNAVRHGRKKRKVEQNRYEHHSAPFGLQTVHGKAHQSDSSTSSDGENIRTRAKDDGWPHPLAKLIGQGGGSSNYFKESREGREMVTQNRDFVRERTKNLRQSNFPTSRVGWHNGLLAIQLEKIKEVLRESILAQTKEEAYHSILDLSSVGDIPVIDVDKAKKWISNERKHHARLYKLVLEFGEAIDHEANIARVVDKEGYSTVAAFEGSAEFDSEFKRHLEYIKRSTKTVSTVKPVAMSHLPKREKISAQRYRGAEGRVMLPKTSNFGKQKKEFRSYQAYRSNNGPSALRPCAICKSPEHWASQCPHRAT